MYYRSNEEDVRDDEQLDYSEMDCMQCPIYQQLMMYEQPRYECPMMYSDRDDYHEDDMFRKRRHRRRRRPCCGNGPYNNPFPWWLFFI